MKLCICTACARIFEKDLAELKDYRHDDGEEHLMCPCCYSEFTREKWDNLPTKEL